MWLETRPEMVERADRREAKMETVTPRSRYSGTNFTPSGRQCQEKVVNILCSAADRRRESRRIRPQQSPGLAGARLPEAEASSGVHLWSNYDAA